MGIFSGYGMKITHADGNGRMPWSPTVVNIQRQKARRGRRALTIVIVLALIACFACSATWAVTQSGKAKKTPLPPTLTPAPTVQVAATPSRSSSPTPRWTPMPGYGDWIKFRMEPLR